MGMVHKNINEDFVNDVSDQSFKLAIIEIGLGSLLHSLKIPLVGHFLSLNQIYFLSALSRKFKNSENKVRAALYVSQICALLKSLSPAGKKLGPMISISMQGLLFCCPLYLFSSNYVSIILGSALSSLWAFFQPLITLYILFGENIIKAFEFYLDKLQISLGITDNSIVYFFMTFIFFKMIFATVIGLSAFMGRINFSYDQIIKDPRPRKQKKPSLLKDLTHPLFLISFFLTGIYLYYNKSILSPTIWTYLRPFAIGIILIRLNRSNLIKGLIEKRQDQNFFQILQTVNQKVERHFK